MKNAYFDLIQEAETKTLPDFLSAHPGKAMEKFHAAVLRSPSEICAAAGITGYGLARRCGISYRTVEAWTSGRRPCPVYLRLMFQELLGLYSPPEL